MTSPMITITTAAPTAAPVMAAADTLSGGPPAGTRVAVELDLGEVDAWCWNDVEVVLRVELGAVEILRSELGIDELLLKESVDELLMESVDALLADGLADTVAPYLSRTNSLPKYAGVRSSLAH